MAALSGFEPEITESKSVALTTWLQGYLIFKDVVVILKKKSIF